MTNAEYCAALHLADTSTGLCMFIWRVHWLIVDGASLLLLLGAGAAIYFFVIKRFMSNFNGGRQGGYQ